MDRSFLSNAEVVAASRKFVCIRLATYEDAKEAEYMKSIFVPRSGALENTTFSLLAPDGKRKLTAAGRSPQQIFRNASHMADTMNRITKKFPAGPNKQPLLPLMKTVDLALNVAASDSLPLIVTFADDAKQIAECHKLLSSIAWSDSLTGQFVYATTTDRKDLRPITGVPAAEQILVIAPGQFGLSGKVMTTVSSLDTPAEVQKKLLRAVSDFPRPVKTHDSHVRQGIELGIDWESEIPETDPMSVRARQRARGNR